MDKAIIKKIGLFISALLWGLFYTIIMLEQNAAEG
jgi:hypothetical protein